MEKLNKMENTQVNQVKKAPFFPEESKIPESERNRFIEKLREIGGSLTFALHQDNEGWTAQCNEIDGIIASDTNPKATPEEIEENIRETVYTAFDVKEKLESPFFSIKDFNHSSKNHQNLPKR